MAETLSTTCDYEDKRDQLPQSNMNIFGNELASLLTESAVYVERCLEAYKTEENEGTVCTMEPLLKNVLSSMHSKIGDIKHESLLPKVLDYLSTISEITKVIKLFCDFVRIVFARLGTTGLSKNLIFCLLTVEHFMWDCCSENSGIREILSQNGMIIHFLYQLGELRKISIKISVVHELISNSIGVLNNFATCKEYHKQFMDIDYYLTFVPYIRSPLVHIRFSALFTFSYFSGMLPAEHFDYLALEPHEVKTIVESLHLALQNSDEVRLADYIFSISEILIILNNLAIQPGNDQLLVEYGIGEVIGIALKSCVTAIRSHSLTLLWMICDRFKDVTNRILSEFFPQSLDEEELVEAILIEVQSRKINTDNAVQAMTACYNYQKYQNCIQIFDVIKESLHNCEFTLRDRIKLLAGKSLYYLAVNEQRMLTKYAADIKSYKLEHEKCFSKIKQVIIMLGETLDDGCIDDEGFKILDFSMIKYVQGTNNLKSCRRCVLCRQKASLKKSHLWPESLLRLFQAGVDTPPGKKVFHHISPEGIVHLSSAHQKSYYMFCFKCEHLLCVNGENQCLPIFKNVIYNANNPSSSSMQLCIQYDKWFYYFCVGLIFRGLVSSDPCVSIAAFTNEDEIYQLIVASRNAILDLDKMEDIPSKFKIAVLFTPVHLKPSEKHTGFINTMLTSFDEFSLSDACLSDGSVCEPREAQFFLAHCGVFNILVPLGRSSEFTLQPEYIIAPIPGTYVVPPSEKRMELLPPGLVSFIRVLADQTEVSCFESLRKLETRSFMKPEPNMEEVIGRSAALDKDIEETDYFIRLPSFLQNPKDISYLPIAFKIKRPNNRPSVVQVPHGHRILLHHTFLQPSSDDAVTIFVAVGSDKQYSLDMPYVIYHSFNDKGIQISGGFFFSPATLVKTDLLPDNLEKSLANTVSQIEVTQLKEKLQKMFELKGFNNVHSLLLHSECTGAVLDTKCVPQRCWYCEDLCEICMKPCSVGCEAVDHSTHIMYRFCSVCWQESEYEETAWPLFSVLQIEKAYTRNSHFPDHKTLLSVKWSSDAFELYTISLCVCARDERLGVLFQTRDLFNQRFTEWYVSQDFSYIQAMPLIDTKMIQPHFKCDDSFVQMVLSYVVSTKNFQNILEKFNSYC